MEIHVDTRALQELEKSLRESGKGVKKLGTELLRGTFEKLVQNAKSRLSAQGGRTTGKLISAIKLQEFLGFDSPTKVIGRYGVMAADVKHTPKAYIRGTMSDDDSYALVAEVGRAPGKKAPQAKDIARWLSQRGGEFYYKNSKGAEVTTTFHNLPTRTQYIVARMVARNIANKGITAKHYMFKDNAMNMHQEDEYVIDFDLNKLADRIAERMAGGD